MANEKTGKHLGMDELTDVQFEAAMLSGELPERNAPVVEDKIKVDTPAEAAAAEPVEQADSTESSKPAVPETAKPEKGKGPKKTAKQRADEVDAEAVEAEAKLEAALTRRRRAQDALRDAEREERPKRAEQDGKQPPADATSKDPAWKKYRAMPDAPQSKDFEDLDDYAAAMGVFIADKRADERFDAKWSEREQQSGAQADFQRELETQTTDAFARAKDEITADPEIVSRIDSRWIAVATKHPDDPSCTPIEFIKANVALHAKRPLNVAAHFNTPEGMKELTALTQMSQGRIVRELAYIDARFVSDATTQDEAADERPSRVSKAPAPAPTLGKKPAAGRDPLKTALEEQDFDKFNELESERERATVR